MTAVTLPPGQPPYVMEALAACGFAVTEDPSLENEAQKAQLLWRGSHLQVWSPKNPRTTDHLRITCNHRVTRFEELGEDAYRELYQVMRKVRLQNPEKGFVTTHRLKDGLWEAHILPQRNEGPVKNLMDKFDSNAFVHQAKTNGLPVNYDNETLNAQRKFWSQALLIEPQLPPEPDTKGEWELHKSHLDAATAMVRWDAKLALEELGGVCQNPPPKPDLKTIDQPSTVITEKKGKCPFCRPDVIARQSILSRDGVHLLYNMQGNNRFLIVMDEHHPEMLYAPDAQVTAMYSIERDLRAALANAYPELAVVTYEQNMPSVGQTVREAHWQVAAYDQGSVFWTGISGLLGYETKGANQISQKEMAEKTAFWREKIAQVAG